MTDDELDAIEERAKAAEEGPWLKCYYGFGGGDEYDHNDPPDECDCRSVHVKGGTLIYDEGGHNWDDALFIAHARDDVPALVAEVRRLRAQYHAAKRGEWHCGDSACGVCNDLDR